MLPGISKKQAGCYRQAQAVHDYATRQAAAAGLPYVLLSSLHGMPGTAETQYNSSRFVLQVCVVELKYMQCRRKGVCIGGEVESIYSGIYSSVAENIQQKW